MEKELLIVFVKNPEQGKVKTRLAESVGEKKALRIYQQLLEYTRSIMAPLEMDKQVWFSEYIPEGGLWASEEIKMRRQKGENLGARMSHAVVRGFGEGYDRIVVIGSDCAELTASVIRAAFRKLKKEDVVLGPSRDGGYYLIGMNRHYGRLFKNKPWSTPEVLDQTLQDIKELEISCSFLPELNDVDTEEDWREVKNRF